MSSGKITLVKVLSVFVILLIISCADKKEDPADKLDLNIPDNARFVAQKVLDVPVSFANKGFFDDDSVLQIAAGVEIQNKEEWGIKFFHLKKIDGDLTSLYETDLLNGSFKGGLTNKIKFPAIGHELVYYNSGDFFLGSGGGEIFCYLIDFADKQAYYAHLVAESGRSAQLYISENVTNADIKNFFISNFKRDYPSLRLSPEDIQLSY